MKQRGGRRLSQDEVQRVFRRFRGKVKPWPPDRVERRDPATYREPSEIKIAICRNPFCRSWTPTRLTYCTTCHMPRDGSAL